MNYKDMFLNKIKNENTRKSYENLFLKMRVLEDILNKKAEDFTEKKEFLLLLEYCCGKSTYNSIYVKWSLLKRYYEYIGNNNIKIISNKDLNKIIRDNKEKDDNRYIPKEKLIKMVNKLENNTDKAILLLARNGIGMEYEAQDLINLRVKDIDFKHNMIYDKKIDDYTMYITKLAMNEKEYVAIGNYDKIIIYNMNSEYLFKTRPTKSTLDGMLPLKPSGFRGRMQKIKAELENDNIILSNLIMSYIIDKVIEYQNEIGKELTQNELKYFLNTNFGFTKNAYDVKKMTRQIIKSGV